MSTNDQSEKPINKVIASLADAFAAAMLHDIVVTLAKKASVVQTFADAIGAVRRLPFSSLTLQTSSTEEAAVVVALLEGAGFKRTAAHASGTVTSWSLDVPGSWCTVQVVDYAGGAEPPLGGKVTP